jgi:hypothetical protein
VPETNCQPFRAAFDLVDSCVLKTHTHPKDTEYDVSKIGTSTRALRARISSNAGLQAIKPTVEFFIYKLIADSVHRNEVRCFFWIYF